MLYPRIIPCLLVKEGGLVKTIEFANPKYVGDPINAVRIFNEKEVDELIVLDIDATSESRELDYDMIAHLAAECRMPLCYGGGVKTIDHVQRIIKLGVEKVSISSAAIENESLLQRSAKVVGAQSIVVVLDVKQAASGDRYEVWTHNGRRNTGKCPVELAQKMGVPQGVFESTVVRYNELARLRKDLDFGKRTDRLWILDKPPYYAGKGGYELLVIMGGINVNTRLQALNKDWEVIPGLYAGGNVVGNRFAVDYPLIIPGISHGMALVYGRIAGINAATLRT